jgi:plastocyanin
MIKRKLSMNIVFAIIIGVIVSTCFMISTNAGLLTKKAPQINQFTSSATSIRVGDKVTLNWSTTGARKIEIIGCDNNGGVLKTTGSKDVSPTKTTTYTLNSYALNGLKTSKSLVVNVNSSNDKSNSKDNTQKVKIVSFTADSTLIKKGDFVEFKWETENAKTVQLISSLGTVYNAPLSGEINVTPNTKRSYTLVAKDASGNEDKKEITIDVFESKAKFISFTSDKTSVKKGENVILKWETENADKVKLIRFITGDTPTSQISIGSPTIVKNNEKDGMEVTINEKTFITLIAADASGVERETTITIEVSNESDKTDSKDNTQKAKIVSFTADSTSVKMGATVTLNWETKNAETVQIVASTGSVYNAPLSGEICVTPNTNRTYTLIAIDTSGNKERKEININIKMNESKVKIISFTSSEESIKKGEHVLLKWETENAERVTLINTSTNDTSIVEKSEKNGLEVTLDKTARFLLIAKDTLGNDTYEELTVNVVDK